MNMSLTKFITTYQGQKVDYDKEGTPQCVDLYRLYLDLVLGIPQTPALGINGGAKDIWNKCGNDLKKISEGVLADYSRGDILIWGATSSNPYGHVAILVEVYNTAKFLVFEQNGFTKDGAKTILRGREGLLGGLYLPGRY